MQRQRRSPQTGLHLNRWLLLLTLTLVAILPACGKDSDQVRPLTEEEMRLVPIGSGQEMVFFVDMACERLPEYDWDMDEAKLALVEAHRALVSATVKSDVSDTAVLHEASGQEESLVRELQTMFTAVNILDEKGDLAENWCRDGQ